MTNNVHPAESADSVSCELIATTTNMTTYEEKDMNTTRDLLEEAAGSIERAALHLDHDRTAWGQANALLSIAQSLLVLARSAIDDGTTSVSLSDPDDLIDVCASRVWNVRDDLVEITEGVLADAREEGGKLHPRWDRLYIATQQLSEVISSLQRTIMAGR